MIAQPLDNTAFYRTINTTSYSRFYYDNDFFTATDQYYSQGINLEWVHPKLRKFPLSSLLIQSNNKTVKFGIALQHLAYTPSSIRHPEIIIGDHPFSASLSLQTFAITVDTVNYWRLSSTLNTGIMGPAAGGEWMQKTIHRNLKNIEPLGWEHQIQNDVVLNYELAFEQLLLSHRQLFALSTYTRLSAGTMHTNASAGVIVMVGKFDNPFLIGNTEATSKRKIQIELYSKPTVNIIGYDATLQGGLFNKSSPYTLSAKDIKRVIFADETGITFQSRSIYLEYFQSISSKEFKTGTYHRWGGIRMGLLL